MIRQNRPTCSHSCVIDYTHDWRPEIRQHEAHTWSCHPCSFPRYIGLSSEFWRFWYIQRSFRRELFSKHFVCHAPLSLHRVDCVLLTWWECWLYVFTSEYIYDHNNNSHICQEKTCHIWVRWVSLWSVDRTQIPGNWHWRKTLGVMPIIVVKVCVFLYVESATLWALQCVGLCIRNFCRIQYYMFWGKRLMKVSLEMFIIIRHPD